MKSGHFCIALIARTDYLALGRAVPLDAKLLIHTFGKSLGIDRDIVMDSIGFQGLISYESMHTPHELYNQFRAHGITHSKPSTKSGQFQCCVYLTVTKQPGAIPIPATSFTSAQLLD